MSKVLVTGGGGFLGGAIVKRLVEQGEQVSSFSRANYSELDALGVDQIRGDLGDKDAVDHACRGMDIVFHVAAKPGVWGRYEDFYQTNTTGTRNVIDACRHHGISRLIYTSSPSVVFNGSDMQGVDESVPYPSRFHAYYPKTKALAEQLVRAATSESLRTITLRPHLIWGPGDNHLVPRIISRANQLMRVGDSKNLVDTVYIDNAADAHILAASQLERNPALSGNVYFISQDDPIPLWDMVDAILNAGGHPPLNRTISRKAAWVAGLIFEIVYTVLRIKSEPRMTRFVAEELATSHWFDISAAKRDLGYLPAVSTEQGLELLAQWLEGK